MFCGIALRVFVFDCPLVFHRWLRRAIASSLRSGAGGSALLALQLVLINFFYLFFLFYFFVALVALVALLRVHALDVAGGMFLGSSMCGLKFFEF